MSREKTPGFVVLSLHAHESTAFSSPFNNERCPRPRRRRPRPHHHRCTIGNISHDTHPLFLSANELVSKV